MSLTVSYRGSTRNSRLRSLSAWRLTNKVLSFAALGELPPPPSPPPPPPPPLPHLLRRRQRRRCHPQRPFRRPSSDSSVSLFNDAYENSPSLSFFFSLFASGKLGEGKAKGRKKFSLHLPFSFFSILLSRRSLTGYIDFSIRFKRTFR